MKEIKCPKCGSTNIKCMDGSGAVSQYGSNIMIDIAPDMWLCSDCKENFAIDDTDNNENKIKLQKIQELEKELSFLIKPGMTTEKKLKALNDSFWRSHNSGFCDYMAGREMGGEVSWETEQWDKDCKYKWEVGHLIDLLKEL